MILNFFSCFKKFCKFLFMQQLTSHHTDLLGSLLILWLKDEWLDQLKQTVCS